jgi:hypothetical protein
MVFMPPLCLLLTCSLSRRGPIKQIFAPNKPSEQHHGRRSSSVDQRAVPLEAEVDYPFVCLIEDGESFDLGMEELLKRVKVILQKSCKEIIHSRVFSRLKLLSGNFDEPAAAAEEQQHPTGVVANEKSAIPLPVHPFHLYRQTFSRHTLSVTCMVLYKDSYLLTGSRDHRVHLWNCSTMEVIHTFPGPAGVHSLFIYMEDYLFIGYTNRSISLWSLQSQTLLTTHSTRQIEAMIVVPSPDPTIAHLYVGHQKSFRRADVCLNLSSPSVKETVSLVGRDDTVYCAVLFQSHIIFTGSVGHTIRAWDLRYFGVDLTIVYLSGHTGRVNCLLIRATQLFSGSDDHSIRVWDILTLTPVSVLVGHEDAVTALVTAGPLLYSASRDHTILIWNLLTNERIHVLRGHSETVNCLAIDQNRLYSGGGDYVIKVWEEPVSSGTTTAIEADEERHGQRYESEGKGEEEEQELFLTEDGDEGRDLLSDEEIESEF